MRYTRIPETAFQELQMNAGILLSDFDPDSGEAKEEDLLGATTGGINFAAKPTFSDFGEDIDNCPVNVLELKRLDSWEVTASGNFITAKVGLVKLLTGAADVDTQDPRKIVPRNDLLTSDFHNLWIVGDYSDKNGDTNGGYMAIHMLNGLSTGGFQLQTTNRGKGQLAFTFTGHYSISAQDKVPFEVYVSPGKAEPSAAVQVPGQSESYLGKQISELVTEDTQVLADGTVEGTLKYVTGFTAFNESEVEEQSGNYMPVKLSMTGSKMTLKKNGVSEPEKTDMTFDPELLFRVSAKSDTFTVEVDGLEVITLSFGQAQLLTQ